MCLSVCVIRSACDVSVCVISDKMNVCVCLSVCVIRNRLESSSISSFLAWFSCHLELCSVQSGTTLPPGVNTNKEFFSHNPPSLQ